VQHTKFLTVPVLERLCWRVSNGPETEPRSAVAPPRQVVLTKRARWQRRSFT